MEQLSKEMKEFRESIFKCEGFAKKFAKLKDYTKAPKLDFKAFEKELLEMKKDRENSSDVYDLILDCTKIVELETLNKRETAKSEQELAIFENACLKAMQKKVKACTPTLSSSENFMDLSDFDTTYMNDRKLGIAIINRALSNCTVYPKKEKEKKSKEKTSEKTLGM